MPSRDACDFILEFLYGIIKSQVTPNGYAKFLIRKSKKYVYGMWVYKVLGIWKGYDRVQKSLK